MRRSPAGYGEVALGVECALPAAYPFGSRRGMPAWLRLLRWLLRLEA